MPHAMWRGAGWLVDAIFEVLRAGGRHAGAGDLAVFGASYSTLIPARVGDAIFGRVGRARTLTVGNTDTKVYALGLNAGSVRRVRRCFPLASGAFARAQHSGVSCLVRGRDGRSYCCEPRSRWHLPGLCEQLPHSLSPLASPGPRAHPHSFTNRSCTAFPSRGRARWWWSARSSRRSPCTAELSRGVH